MTFRDRIVLLVLALVLAGGNFAASAATLELSGPAGATCMINDQNLGFFPLDGPLDLESGIYTIKATLPGHFPFEKTIHLQSSQDWVRVHTGLLPLKKSTALQSNLLYAGLGQFYMDKKIKGWVFSLAETGGLLTALAAEAQRSNYRKDYLLLKHIYDTSISNDEIIENRSKSETAYNNMEDMEEMRNMGLMVAGGAVLLSILDALILFPSTEMGPGTVPLQTGFNSVDTNTNSDLLTSFHAGIRVDF